MDVDVAYYLHDADWYMDNTRGEFASEREVSDDGELGVYDAPVPATGAICLPEPPI